MVSGVRPRDTARRAATVRRCGICLPELEHDRVVAAICELHASLRDHSASRHRSTAKPDRPRIGTDIVACRSVHIQPPRPVDTLLNDVRYATRMAWKHRIVTLVAVASLAAGIGANSAVFSLVNAILLRPLGKL